MPRRPSGQENALNPFYLEFPATADRLIEVRRALRSWLAAIPVGQTLADDVILAAGEACTNAVEHAHHCDGGPVEIDASLTDGHILVVVTDHGSWRPSASPADAARGRGLTIMRAVSSEFDVETSESGTVVTMLIACG
ncbi:ATP-binding protein [Nocardia caishijiensis]|uniref:ATP-binding protein n=1 Tax=Nocardia caishijiensis TaxID=184756 RepID=UPI00082C4270|nr:ATP-binding protein [Nocardia caishijiensis]